MIFLSKILRFNVWDAGHYSVAEGLYPLFLVLVAFLAPYTALAGGAMIFAAIDLIQRSINPIKDISAKIANIQRAYSGIWRIQEFLGDLSELPSFLGHSTHGTRKFDELCVDVNFFFLS